MFFTWLIIIFFSLHIHIVPTLHTYFFKRVWGPFIVEAYTNPIVRSVYVRGLFYDIWQILEAKLNFSTILTKMKDGKSKGWSFIMQTVVEKKHDLFLAGNSLTESRQSLSCDLLWVSAHCTYHRGLSTLKKYQCDTMGLHKFFHYSAIVSCITFHI